jgi:hypothetical protein
VEYRLPFGEVAFYEGACWTGHRFGDIDPGFAGAVGARGSPVKSVPASFRVSVRAD